MSEDLNSGLYGSKIRSVLPLSLICTQLLPFISLERTQVRPAFLYVQINTTVS